MQGAADAKGASAAGYGEVPPKGTLGFALPADRLR